MKTFGEMIREQRVLKGLTLEQLAEGLSCGVNTLSEIERGTRKPSQKIMKGLIQKFNLPQNAMGIYGTSVDLETLEIIERINDAIRYDQLRGLKHELTLLKGKVKGREVEDELIGLVEIIVKEYEGVANETLYHEMSALLKTSLPRYEKPKQIRELSLTIRQVVMLSRLAKYARDAVEARSIWSELKRYIDTRGRYRDACRPYVRITYRLAKAMYQMGDYGRCITTAEKGLDICLRYDVWSMYPRLLEIKGLAFLAKGDERTAHRLLNEALVIYRTRGEGEAVKKITQQMGEKGVKVVDFSGV